MRPRLVCTAATTVLALLTPLAPAASSAAAALPAAPALPAAVAAPVAAAPVTPSVVTVPIPTVTPSARSAARASSSAAGPRVVAAVSRSGTKFDVVGVTYRGTTPAGFAVEARTHSGQGWTGWIPLDVDDEHGPDAGTPESRLARAGTAPLTAAGSDAVEVRVLSDAGTAPRDLDLSLVDAKTSPADAAVAASPVGTSDAPADASSTASRTATTSTTSTAPSAVTTATTASPAAVAQPTIVTRAQWGADDRMMPCQPDHVAGFKAAVVHHTVNANTYSSAQAPALMRGIFAYHTQSQGWCDIGYNFLVDRFGRIYEGRKGGITGFTLGAQAGGFNGDTFGVSVIGTFTNVRFPSAVVSAVTRTIAWQADRSGFDPATSVTMTSQGNSRYDPGVRVTKPRVMGHRDLSLTGCPGDAAYPQLAGIRSSAAASWRAGQFVVGRATYVPVTPRRVLDTRSGLGATRRPVPGNTSVVLRVPGLPSTATAVTLNVTALGSTTSTYVTAYPANVSRRATSNLYVYPRRTVATQVTVGVAPGGTVRLYNAAGTVQLVADLAGYFRTGAGPGYTASARPTRVLDTRTGLGAPARKVLPSRPVTFRVPGLPAGTRAVSLNLTAVNASQPTYLTAYRAGTARPGVSSLNVDDARPLANLVTIPVDPAGRVTVTNAHGQVDLLADVAGYYADGRGARFVAVAPRRLMDTRYGWNVRRGAIAGGSAVTVGVVGTAYPVVGAVVAGTGISGSTGWVTFYRAGQSPPATSTLNTVPGRAVANLASIGTLSSSLFNVSNARGSTHVIGDLMGYWTP